MASKRIIAPSAFSIPTLARTSVRSAPSPPQAGYVATRAKSNIAVSSHHAPLARRCSSASTTAPWMQKGVRTGSSLARSRETTSRSFTISASLRREAAEQGNQKKPEDIEFKEYMFEDISSTLPSSPSSASPSATPIIIDVREPAELSSTGKIPTALPLPIASQPDALFLDEDEFLTRFGYPKPTLSPLAAGRAVNGRKKEGRAEQAGTRPAAPREKSSNDMVFYCKAGVRAKAAAQLAAQAGYDPNRIGVYMGSWLDWVKNGGRVEKWEPEE